VSTTPYIAILLLLSLKADTHFTTHPPSYCSKPVLAYSGKHPNMVGFNLGTSHTTVLLDNGDNMTATVRVIYTQYRPIHIDTMYTVSQKKLCQCYFVNNSVKHWPNLIILGVQHREET